ncbi:Alkyl hydroperoxide reductase subunit C-like protein [Labilithrix luteola]|uniref:Alkyl hydroperoxide reductase subunit C-like protein n=1 Tax=Labilithrix luteola TaxID=1391654 RepID=A0A0K1Q9L3_9BACT|nr:redoxin domain-containing protein [Labilithrix luteola]AKV02486.1 Alkyl hydroperoxide reductase subunit C-like protein [Labilithrix luteola]
MIQVGSEAPDFELPSNELTAEGRPGKPIKLSSFRGKKNVVLAFYPLDFSPTCSKEHACFKDDSVRIDGANAQVLGISVDSVWAHQAFAKQMGIGYPLLADFQPRGAVGEKYGLFLADKGIDGRATVIVDKAGKVAWYQKHDGQRSDDEILAVLAKLG